jgi:phenylalanyl-tRNA synthetase beta chain
MPTISVDKQDLFEYLNEEFTTEEFDKLCFEFGLELDEDVSSLKVLMQTSLNPVIVDGVTERPVLKIEVAANR